MNTGVAVVRASCKPIERRLFLLFFAVFLGFAALVAATDSTDSDARNLRIPGLPGEVRNALLALVAVTVVLPAIGCIAYGGQRNAVRAVAAWARVAGGHRPTCLEPVGSPATGGPVVVAAAARNRDHPAAFPRLARARTDSSFADGRENRLEPTDVACQCRAWLIVGWTRAVRRARARTVAARLGLSCGQHRRAWAQGAGALPAHAARRRVFANARTPKTGVDVRVGGGTVVHLVLCRPQPQRTR